MRRARLGGAAAVERVAFMDRFGRVLGRLLGEQAGTRFKGRAPKSPLACADHRAEECPARCAGPDHPASRGLALADVLRRARRARGAPLPARTRAGAGDGRGGKPRATRAPQRRGALLRPRRAEPAGRRAGARPPPRRRQPCAAPGRAPVLRHRGSKRRLRARRRRSLRGRRTTRRGGPARIAGSRSLCDRAPRHDERDGSPRPRARALRRLSKGRLRRA